MKQVIKILVPAEKKAELKRIAKEKGFTLTTLIAVIIDDYLKNEGEK